MLYRYGLSIVLLGIERAKEDLRLATVKYLARILLHVEWGIIILCNLYSSVGMMIVLMI